jgi:hypothetical protein
MSSAASIRSVSEQVGIPQVFLLQQDFFFHNLEMQKNLKEKEINYFLPQLSPLSGHTYIGQIPLGSTQEVRGYTPHTFMHVYVIGTWGRGSRIPRRVDLKYGSTW